MFAVNASAVLLTIKTHRFGLDYSFAPASAKILIIKFDTVLRSHLFCYGGNEVMLLIFAVQEGSRISAESFLARRGGDCLQTHPVTLLAPESAFASDTEQKFVEVVSITIDHLESDPGREIPDSLKPPAILLVGMNVRIVEITRGIHSLFPKTEIRVKRAGGTTDMEKNVHDKSFKGVPAADRDRF